MEFKHAQLDNGLTAIAEVNPLAASMAVGFFAKTGSRDETPAVAGVSHFLEHMMFKGTERRSAFDVNREFDEMGANYNAFTSEENTVYYAAVLPEFQDRAVDLLADILRPSLRREDFDTEKNVILEEIALYDDLPHYRVHDKLMAAFFAGHPLGNSVLGTRESIAALQRDDMLAYFSRRYAPGNVTVVGVGDLDFDRFAEQLARQCAHWEPCEAPRQTPAADGCFEQKTICDEKVLREHVGLMARAPTGQDPRRFAAQLVATILGDHTGSRFYYALVDPAIVDEASMSYGPMDQAGAFHIFLSAGADRAAEAVRIARAELETFKNEGPTDAELHAAKNKIATGATLTGETPMGRLTAVGADWVYRREYLPLADQIEMLFDVTGQQVCEVAREFDVANTAVLALGPLESL